MIVKEMVKQSLPLLILCGIGELCAGTVLESISGSFHVIPGLIVMIPAVIALRGNISAALGSRLGSAYHLGVISLADMWNEDMKQNIYGSLTLSVVMSFFIGLLAYLTSMVLGLHVGFIKLVVISLFAGTLSGVILIGVAALVIAVAFKKGYNPDNITGPILTTVGDVVTMLCIFTGLIVVEALL
ncbi:MAG TPA: divalent cation transporter [Thermoplasmata archaeon]|nr:divalent cation transporter [Thermoplasmata archaeon]